jgi:hypothetical protein
MRPRTRKVVINVVSVGLVAGAVAYDVYSGAYEPRPRPPLPGYMAPLKPPPIVIPPIPYQPVPIAPSLELENLRDRMDALRKQTEQRPALEALPRNRPRITPPPPPRSDDGGAEPPGTVSSGTDPL